jgi:hypothetical protein
MLNFRNIELLVLQVRPCMYCHKSAGVQDVVKSDLYITVWNKVQ